MLHTLPDCTIKWRGEPEPDGPGSPWAAWTILAAVFPAGSTRGMASIARRNLKGAQWEAKIEWYDAPAGRLVRIERPDLDGATDFATAARRFETAFNTMDKGTPHAP